MFFFIFFGGLRIERWNSRTDASLYAFYNLPLLNTNTIAQRKFFACICVHQHRIVRAIRGWWLLFNCTCLLLVKNVFNVFVCICCVLIGYSISVLAERTIWNGLVVYMYKNTAENKVHKHFRLFVVVRVLFALYLKLKISRDFRCTYCIPFAHTIQFFFSNIRCLLPFILTFTAWVRCRCWCCCCFSFYIVIKIQKRGFAHRTLLLPNCSLFFIITHQRSSSNNNNAKNV